jgi:protein FRG1
LWFEGLVRKTEPEPEDNQEDQSWVSADSPSDIAGPVVIVLRFSSLLAKTWPLASLATQVASSEGRTMTTGPAMSLGERQVWVASRVAGTESFSFKGHHGK